MREIGGYFGLDNLISEKGEYYSNFISLNTARNAVAYIVQARKISKLYIPYMLCDSVADLCNREDIKYEQYHIDDSFMPIFNKELKESEYIYFVNLYGQCDNSRIALLKEKYKRIIVDNTHAFFQEPLEKTDTIYSCRKFFGVPDGSYVSTDAAVDFPLQDDDSSTRLSHIYGRNTDGAAVHYSEFLDNEKKLNQLPLKNMSKKTHNLLSMIDYERVKGIRKKNFSFLADRFNSINKLKLTVPEGPFMYPLYCRDAAKIKKELIKHCIYIPTLWPNVLEYPGTLECDYAMNILPLPCDQRYILDDMAYMVDMILKELNK